MKKALIQFELEKPSGVNDNEFIAWIRFELGQTGEISMENPMEYACIENEIKNFKLRTD